MMKLLLVRDKEGSHIDDQDEICLIAPNIFHGTWCFLDMFIIDHAFKENDNLHIGGTSETTWLTPVPKPHSRPSMPSTSALTLSSRSASTS